MQHKGSSAGRAIERQLALLPEAGSSGIVDQWFSAKIRGKKSKCQNKECMRLPPHQFRLEFEEFKQGQADPDDGTYDLLDAEVDWHFTSPPPSVTAIESTGGRVAPRTRH